MTMDQLGNQAAKIRGTCSAARSAPMVLLDAGRHRAVGRRAAQPEPEAYVMHTLACLAMPATVADALITCSGRRCGG